MYGIIDIGSNTMRLSCYRVVDKQLLPTFHKKNMAGLAGYVDKNHCLSEKGIAKAVETLRDFQKIVSCVGLDKLYVIATASFRNVDNTDEIVKKILERTGMEVEVLSGKKEATYDFKGATYCTASDAGMLVDIGGGSTELVAFENRKIVSAESLPIGSLKSFSDYVEGLFPTDEEAEKIRENVRKHLDKMTIDKKQKNILGVGGSIRASLKLYNEHFDCEAGNVVMECEKLTEVLQELGHGKKEGMAKILKIVPDRIHTILPGMLVLDEIATYYKGKRIQLSSGGVREGYMVEKVL